MVLLKTILVATDFSEPSDAALRYGRALAQRFDATLIVLHVADVVTTGMGAEGGTFVDAQRHAEEAALLRVDALLTDADRRALRARAVAIASILPADTIVGFATRADVDLIVLGTHGRSGLAHMLVGSVAESVVRTAPCPVLTVKHGAHEFVFPDRPLAADRPPHLTIALNHILVSTDFSEISETAVRYGVALARVFHARLSVLHVEARRDLETMVEGELVVEKSLREMGVVHGPQNAARELLGKILTEQEQTDVQAEYVLRASGVGGPSVEIVRYAQERHIDVIVLGTHGRTGVAHLLAGSVAETVVRTARCPVLTVRDPEHGFVMREAAAAAIVDSTADRPARNDICLRQTGDDAWSVFEGDDERFPRAAGLHLTDRRRAQELGQDIASSEKVDLWVYENGCYVRVTREQAAEPRMSDSFEWRSLSPVRYGRGEGSAVLNFVAETGCFEYGLPGESLRVFDATSFDDLHRLKDQVEATLGSAHDMRSCVSFIDRHAMPSH
jgi:nucleotide-binding universal stress UspA family protein